jgi:Arc/MetJ family transcription regulator
MSDLLKEAIADAKAVRETALQNAKMALEEAFTPHLKSMLSAKLAEDEEEEDPFTDDEDEGDETAEDMARQYDEDDEEEVDIDIDAGDEEEVEQEPEEEDEGLGYDESEIIEIDGVKYAPIVSEEEHEGEEDLEQDEDLDLEAVIRELEQEIAEADGEAVSEDDETVSEEELDEYSGTKAEKRAKDGNVVRQNEETVSEDESEEEEDSDEDKNEHVDQLQSELSEYKEAITYLRDKLHEVNILNAKLLYTNRLFREFGLSNDQKLKIVETFDRAQTTREIKLVYSTLAESFKDTGFVTKKSTVKESASRKTGTTAPQKKIITEEDQIASRFQKLAGILKD